MKPLTYREAGVDIDAGEDAVRRIAPLARATNRPEVIGGIGAFLLVAGLVYSPILKYPSAWWWRFSRALGYVNARILLTILFSVVLVPLSIIWRLTGKDPLSRKRAASPGWTPYPARYRDRKHYERMY